MNGNCNWNPIQHARIRTYNSGEGRDMRATPVQKTAQGAFLCARTEQGNWQIGWEWDAPRDIVGVSVRFDGATPALRDWHVEYWQNAWPAEHGDRRVGAHKGWIPTDDAFHGRWLTAYGEQRASADGVDITFDHMDVNEVMSLGPEMQEHLYLSDDYNAPFRRALKFRVVMDCDETPRIAEVRLTGAAALEQDACTLYPCATGRGNAAIVVRGLHNGELLSGQGAVSGGTTLHFWRTRGAENPEDQSILELSAGGVGFGVALEDMDPGVYMEDYDLLIAPASFNGNPADKVADLLAGKRSIFDRVPEHPEQTIANALRDVPEMRKQMQPPFGRYVVLGWEDVRQKFALRYNGDIFANKVLQKVSRRDTAKTHWAANELHYRLASGDPPRRLEGDHDTEQFMPDPRVPVYVTRWIDRNVEYTQTTFATLLGAGDRPIRGDEDLLLMNRVVVRNISVEPRKAHLFVELYPSETLSLDDGALMASGRVRPSDTPDVGWAVQPYDRSYLRATVDTHGQGSLRCVPFIAAGTTSLSMQPQFGFEGYDRNMVRHKPSSCVSSSLLYEVELGCEQSACVDFRIAYPSLSDRAEIDSLKQYDFDAELARVSAYWLALGERGASLDIPGEKKLTSFAQAVPWHVILTATRDLATGLYTVPAGTMGYGACGNEAALQIRMLDYLGYHDYAEKYLDTFIQSQGVGSMDGNFRSHDGAFVANNYGGYQDAVIPSFAYNLDHGYVLTCMIEHYRLTGDKQWLRRVADALVKACDYVTYERSATQLQDERGEKVGYFGMLPHGHLEDNDEWRCWFSVNAHACGGMLRTAGALREIDHPQADRLAREAEAYRQDVVDCARRAMAKSPAVPTGNGGYMPHVPTQAEIRGRDWGWFREAAYGPLHLATCGLIPCDDEMTTWILRDLEDNLFLSRIYGRAVDRQKEWFSLGGMTIQANLLFNDMLYLQRGESERAIRALCNNFAQNLYRDVNCFSEHPITDFGLGYGPFYKTPDESQFIANLRNHLLREDGDTLCLLQGACRGWLAAGETLSFERMASYFGPVSLRLAAEEDELRVTIQASWRNAPRQLALFLRTPDTRTPKSVTVNGVAIAPDAIDGEVVRLSTPAETLELIVRY